MYSLDADLLDYGQAFCEADRAIADLLEDGAAYYLGDRVYHVFGFPSGSACWLLYEDPSGFPGKAPDLQIYSPGSWAKTNVPGEPGCLCYVKGFERFGPGLIIRGGPGDTWLLRDSGHRVEDLVLARIIDSTPEPDPEIWNF